MDKKMLFIYNPHAGKAAIRSNLMDIIDIFAKAEYEVTAYPTRQRGDAVRATLEKAGKYDLVVCSGGDGTLDEVVEGMMKRTEPRPYRLCAGGNDKRLCTQSAYSEQYDPGGGNDRAGKGIRL